MYSYYLVDKSEAKDPLWIDYCKTVLVEHDGRIYNLFFWEGKDPEDFDWPDWIERLIPKISAEGSLGVREKQIIGSIQFD